MPDATQVSQEGLVSIIIPAYNAEKWILQCIESVTAQTYINQEIIVIDDGSRDQTVELLQQQFGPRIRLFCQENRGQADATATGMNAARGEFIAFLDSDDVWLPNKLSQQVAFMRNHPSLDIVYTNAEEFTILGVDHRRYLDRHPRLRYPEDVMAAMLECQIPLRSTAMLKRSFLLETGVKTDPLSGSVDDIGLFMEIVGHGGRFGLLNEVTTFRRMHSSNFSRNHFKRFSARIPMYERLLTRSGHCPKEWRAIVLRSLSDAEFRVGEFYWGELDTKMARQHFYNALKANLRNYRAALGWTFCVLPHWSIRTIRRVKNLLIN